MQRSAAARASISSVGAERAGDLLARLVARHRDDLLGAQHPGGEHAAQPDRAVADHDRRAALPDAGGDRRVPAGRHHVGDREHRGQQRRVGCTVGLDQAAVGLGDPGVLGLAAAGEPEVVAGVLGAGEAVRTGVVAVVERHHDGRPDMIGMEAVNQLLVALEVHRFDFCFIGAGYEKEVDEFLTVNPGLAGRFNRKLRFESYSPDELVEIAVRYGRPRASTIDPAAMEALNAACRALRAHRAPDGTHGIDVMQNGRFARNVVERAERLRDSRVAAQHRTDRGSVTVEDLARVIRTYLGAPRLVVHAVQQGRAAAKGIMAYLAQPRLLAVS